MIREFEFQFICTVGINSFCFLRYFLIATKVYRLYNRDYMKKRDSCDNCIFRIEKLQKKKKRSLLYLFANVEM